MQTYKSKFGKLAGTSYKEVMGEARREYHTIQKRTPRRVPYVRSKYFTKDKIFLNNFWEHLGQKYYVEQVKRLKYYKAALDLIRHTTCTPESIIEHNNQEVFLFRFTGQTREGDYFYVQIKDNRRSGRKDFMSVFPIKKPKK